MPVSGFDNSSATIAGRRVQSKNQGVVGKQALKDGQGNSTFPAALKALSDLASVDAYLAASTAHGVGYYSPKRLAQMNRSDKIHAAQMIGDPTSFR